MLRFAKRICWLAMLGAGVQYAAGFALLGPTGQGTGVPDGYQQIVIGYQLPGDIGTPKNLGEEFRRNTPVMYYTMDANYYDFFGSHGSNAIVQAFEMMNEVFNLTNVDGRVITNVSAFSQGLNEFPMVSQEFNFLAQALLLADIKSVTLSLLVEQLGLAEPDRWTWTLRDRVGGNACPITTVYDIVQRNFDPVFSPTDQLQYSSYVNGTLYTYIIFEICSPPPATIAEAIEFPADQGANIFNAVASGLTDFGGFFTGLTRDDVGGLRYLYRTNNMNVESAGPDTFTRITNTVPQLLFTSNLTLFVDQALTNDAPALNALYPNLIITGTTPLFTNVVTATEIFYFTNFPYDPAGTPAHLVSTTVLTTNVVTLFRHQFANLVTNTYSTNVLGFLLTTNVSTTACSPYVFPGTICTNVSLSVIAANLVVGDFYIIPSNLCELSIISTQLVQTVLVTNLVLVATNAPGATNVTIQEFSQSLVYPFTQHIFVVRPVACPSNSVALRQGIERIRFEHRAYDSLLNRFFYPVTNEYTLFAITNNTVIPQRVQRVLLETDFLITASDFGDQDPGNNVLPGFGVARNIVFDTTNVAAAYPGLAGPGTISRSPAVFAPGSVFDYTKLSPLYNNQFQTFFFGAPGVPAFVAHETNQIQLFAWGSFDASTNAPVVYPNGTSITNLENAVLIFVSPSTPMTNGVVQLPNATVGVNYANVFGGFTAVGGQQPYVWTLADGSPALPPDLVLNPDGTISGAPDPSTAGMTFDFVIRMTDAVSRFVDRSYAITINP